MSQILAVPHRRRREGKTDYRKRLRLLKSRKSRVVVRRSTNTITCQIVDYNDKGDFVKASANSQELKKLGWTYHTGNIPASYLTGLLCAKRSEVKEAILDTGLFHSKKGSCLYSALKGVLDGGLNVPHSEDILPAADRVSGKHISDYAEALKKGKPSDYKKQFSSYIKNKTEPANMQKTFEEVKNKILSEKPK